MNSKIARKIPFFWIDQDYQGELNSETMKFLKSNSKFFDLKCYNGFEPAFKEMLQIPFGLIFVLISGRFYQDLYKKLKELKSKLDFIPITLIYTSINFKKSLKGEQPDKYVEQETIDSIGDEYYNYGGLATTPEEIVQFVENFLETILEEKTKQKIFNFEKIENNFENCILPCLYYKSNIKSKIINNEEINEFNHRLKDKHPDDVFSQELPYYLKQGNLPINFAIKLLIKYYTSNNTFKEIMNSQFNQNNFSNYKPFIKGLNRGLSEKDFLKSKFDAPLYYGCYMPEEDVKDLKNKLDKSKKQLIYSKYYLSFYQNKDALKKKFINNKGKNPTPVLFEVNISKTSEPYTINFDISKYSENPEEKEVIFPFYTCFVIDEKIEEKKMEFNSEKTMVKVVKLKYLGDYANQINKELESLDEKKIKKLLDNKSYEFSKDINSKFEKEFPNLEQHDLIKSLYTEVKLIIEKNKHNPNYTFPKNIIEIKMDKKGKFLSDEFFDNNNWMFNIYYDDELQEVQKNEIDKDIPPDIIKIEINYPLFDCSRMFFMCYNITEINFVTFDTSHVTNMREMFSDCRSLISVNFDKFDTSKVIDMGEMFSNCCSMKDLDLSKFKTDSVKNMSAMFMNASSLDNLNFDLSQINISKLEDISFMFSQCHPRNFNVTNFDFQKIAKHTGFI